jgi:Rrf2 family protein
LFCYKNFKMITQKCKYAIKAILHIAKHQNEEKLVFASEIAEQEQIPKKFLETILRDLRNHGIISSRRGKFGGYHLLKKPEEITFTEIIRIVDGPIAMLPCVSLNYYTKCDDCNEEICQIKNVFEKVRNVTLDVLNNSSVSKLI